MIKAVLLDFDGTLVNADMLSVVSSIVGKQAESEQLDKDFIEGLRPGLSSLVERINFLKGVSIEQIIQKLDEQNYLTDGAKKLFEYLHAYNITSIVYSGNILPILQYYQKLLGVDYVFGTSPFIEGNKIGGISEKDAPKPGFKLAAVTAKLADLKIGQDETLAVGDSPADKAVLEFAGTSVVINPKGGIEKSVDHKIVDLAELIPIIDTLNQK